MNTTNQNRHQLLVDAVFNGLKKATKTAITALMKYVVLLMKSLFNMVAFHALG